MPARRARLRLELFRFSNAPAPIGVEPLKIPQHNSRVKAPGAQALFHQGQITPQPIQVVHTGLS
jgi:hypothetical protein